jgi:hypothetical protein
MKYETTDAAALHALLPIDLPHQRETEAGVELEQFLQMRWIMTAALLRSELRNGKTAPCES